MATIGRLGAGLRIAPTGCMLSPRSATVKSPEHDLHPTQPELFEVTLQNHLTAAALAQALGPVQNRIGARAENLRLLFDCRSMTGYDRAARELFVSWHRGCSARSCRIAILVANPLWHLVIAAMALASGKEMKPFSDRPSAIGWLSRLALH
jgi:hypothetical protein